MSPKNRKSTSESPSELIADKKKLTDLVGRAQNGDRKVLPTLRKVLDEEPNVARIVNLARDVEHSLVKAMSGDDLFCQEAIPRNLSEMRDEIAGENPSALERLLAERIAVCWLQLQYYEAIYAQNLSEFTIAQGEHHQRRIDKAHRRYLSAMRALAQIRKLGPAVQINIADKQINTTGRTQELLALERRMNAIKGMDLSGKGGYFRFSNHAWCAALQLAHEHGQEPARTEPPEFTVYAPDGVTVDEVRTRASRQYYANWGGGYFTNDFQVVCDEDANIADALKRALDYVPDELSQEEFGEALEQSMERRAAPPHPQIPLQPPSGTLPGRKTTCGSS